MPRAASAANAVKEHGAQSAASVWNQVSFGVQKQMVVRLYAGRLLCLAGSVSPNCTMKNQPSRLTVY
jgi:hypothetical protein